MIAIAETPVNDDLLDPQFIQNPSPYYQLLREHHPVHWNERWRGWVLTRYEDIASALHNPKLLADRITHNFNSNLSPEEQKQFAFIYEVLNTFLVFIDPPRHTHLKRIFSRAFTPRTLNTMRGLVQEIAGSLLDKWEGRDSVDLVSEFAYPFPANVIASIIGVPRELLHRINPWSDALSQIMLAGNGDEHRIQRCQDALIEFKEFLGELYDERLKQPRDDMMSWLMEVQLSEPELTRDHVLHSCILMVVAGHETTQSLLGNTLTTLLREPEQMALLQGNPKYVKTAIEEGLRYNGPVRGTMRVVGEDFEMRGKTIKQGERVLMLFGAANRDPQKFSDPERFDITRDPNPHFSFSHGVHFCLGAPLARMEMEIALPEMLRRFPKMTLQSDVQWEPRILGRSIAGEIRIGLN